MWRNVITTFGRSLVITRRHLGASNYLKWNGHLGNVAFNNGTRSLCSITLLRNNDEATSESVTDFRTDADYITPYRVEHEQRVSTQFFLDTLHSRFRLSHTEVEQILNDEAVSKCEKRRSMASTLDFMIMEGVTKKSFVANPWMLTLDERSVVKKVNVLKTIKHMRDINDFVPLLRVKAPRLRKVVLDLNRESKYIENGNRIYYIAAKLDVPAALITKYLSKRLFVLQMPYDMFNSNLQHMINYKVDPMSLLKDLWAFRYTPRVVEIRLRRAQQAKKDKLMPWMVRCPESILQKTFKLSLDEDKVLDNKSSVAEYVGYRLGFSPADAQAILDRYPQANTVRVPKIKEVLDYLLIEEKFTRHEIAQVPRVLCHSLKTTKQRIEELKKYNCRPTSLIILCLSRREYEKFLNAWTENYTKFGSVEKNEDDIKKDNQQ